MRIGIKSMLSLVFLWAFFYWVWLFYVMADVLCIKLHWMRRVDADPGPNLDPPQSDADSAIRPTDPLRFNCDSPCLPNEPPWPQEEPPWQHLKRQRTISLVNKYTLLINDLFDTSSIASTLWVFLLTCFRLRCSSLLRIRIIHSGRLDPDPHWEYRSGSDPGGPKWTSKLKKINVLVC